jgi:hypothetical protein
MVATRRPELLAATLQSFRRNLFAQVPVRRFYLNIDPLWGSEDDDAGVERIARDFFPDVEVSRPSTPSFGAAVKRVWSKPETEWFLHIEDDWLLIARLRPWRLEAAMRDREVVQISLCQWGWDTRLKRPAGYSSGPAFRRASFAKRVAQLLDPALDPEKQVGQNAPLAAYVSQHRFRYYGGPLTRRNLKDIGREWRNRRGITKVVVGGVSEWR